MDVLAEPAVGSDVDVLLISVGAVSLKKKAAADVAHQAGFTVRVVDPRWVTPIDPGLVELARTARLVVTVEDGVEDGGVGSRIAQHLRRAGMDVPTREIGVPVRFLTHGKVPDVKAAIGLTPLDIGRRIVEWSALIDKADGGPDVTHPAEARQLRSDGDVGLAGSDLPAVTRGDQWRGSGERAGEID
ncbi:MAG: hypothetical protein JO147_05050 [Actinobacteria bacterium]|nr:hypothetical protein [Actinomycetota bacterium]